MVDFANANLCGASPELNDVLSKFEDAKADITAKLDASASAASAAFGEARNELEGLKNKLQTIEIPAIPKLNLQAEIASLTSLVPATPSFISALAKVKLEFEDDIKGAGLDLDTLVADATLVNTLQSIKIPDVSKLQAGLADLASLVPSSAESVIALEKVKLEFGADIAAAGLNLETLVASTTASFPAGGDLCALVPNLEKEAGSVEAATIKPAAVVQAVENAVSEAVSVIQQNPNLSKNIIEIKKKMEAFTVTTLIPTIEEVAAMKIPPEIDTDVFKIIDEVRKISTPTGIINIAPLGTGKNVAGNFLNFLEKVKNSTKAASLESEKTITDDGSGGLDVISSTPVSGNANRLALDTVTTPSSATAARSGFPNRRTRSEFKFPARDIEDLGKDGTFKSLSGEPLFNFKTTLAHEPMGRIKIRIHPSVEGRNSILDDPGPYTEEQKAANEVYIGRIFKSAYGLHMFDWIDTQGVGSIGHLYVKVNGKEINFASPFSLTEHLGDIDSGGNNADFPKRSIPRPDRPLNLLTPGGKRIVGNPPRLVADDIGQSLGGPDKFQCVGVFPPSVARGGRAKFGPKFLSDTRLNNQFAGTAVTISFEYLENYDPNSVRLD